MRTPKRELVTLEFRTRSQNPMSWSTKRDLKVKGDVKDSVSIPLELITEILTKLPLQTLVKLISVSKLWYSIIRGKYFTALFMAQSLTRPCVLFIFRWEPILYFHLDSRESPTWTTFDKYYYNISPPSYGLICCNKGSEVVICNPSTGQVKALPNLKTRELSKCLFGYDSVEDVYKVLFMPLPHITRKSVPQEPLVYTLGAENKKTWKMIKCELRHFPCTKGLCKEGIIYYGARTTQLYLEKSFLVGFSVRLEEFIYVKVPDPVRFDINGLTELVSYHKKIAFVQKLGNGMVNLWVLEDVQKQIWSSIYVAVTLSKILVNPNDYLSCIGMISTGEFVFQPHAEGSPDYIVYYDKKKDYARKVEVVRSGDSDVKVYLDHVESCKFL